jgi:hypothetical protein
MVHIHRTARKSTGRRLIIWQLAPQGTLRQPEETTELQQKLDTTELLQEEESSMPQ